VTSNSRLFHQLVSSNAIAVRPGEIFKTKPPSFTRSWSRVEGMMIGLAIGDALGNTTEAQLPGERRRRYGEIHDYLPNRFVNGQRKGTPSDDSQLAFWTLECFVEDGRYEPAQVAQIFASRPIFGIGTAVSDFVANMRTGVPWHAAGTASAGNGSLMRVAPVVIPHLRRPTPDLWVDAALLAMTTHNDPASVSSCVAFTWLLWQLLGLENAPDLDWWRSGFLSIVRELETDQSYASRGGWYSGTEGRFSDLVATRLTDAADRGWSVADACDAFYSGAYLLETVPCVLYILMKSGRDPEQAITHAVNDTYDNDTIGAIVGAAVGALHGVDALPRRWREGLTGRTAARDDGRMFEILEAARKTFFGDQR
jgi:ADP-ribosyl-[dinitrogen reductase] hydrolase